MPLLERLKEARGHKPGKQPWPMTAFAAVAAIVQAFDLQSAAQIDAAAVPPSPGTLDRLSLFPLLDPEQYHLTMAIIRQYNNPYLSYARSPVDIAVSRRLFERRPDLDSATLAATPLAVLWLQYEEKN